MSVPAGGRSVVLARVAPDFAYAQLAHAVLAGAKEGRKLQQLLKPLRALSVHDPSVDVLEALATGEQRAGPVARLVAPADVLVIALAQVGVAKDQRKVARLIFYFLANIPRASPFRASAALVHTLSSPKGGALKCHIPRAVGHALQTLAALSLDPQRGIGAAQHRSRLPRDSRDQHGLLLQPLRKSTPRLSTHCPRSSTSAPQR